jgi:hypothetical protein
MLRQVAVLLLGSLGPVQPCVFAENRCDAMAIVGWVAAMAIDITDHRLVGEVSSVDSLAARRTISATREVCSTAGAPIAVRPRSHHISLNACRRGVMAETRKARAMGMNHVALEVGDIEETLTSTVACSNSSFVASAGTPPSSILAISSSRFSRAANNPAVMDATSVSSSTTRRRCARRSLPPASSHRPLPGFPRSVGKPHRHRWLRKHPVHQGAACAARHGAGGAHEERRR